MNQITIEVTVNGSSVYRNYQIEDLDNVTHETYGQEVADIIETIKNTL